MHFYQFACSLLPDTKRDVPINSDDSKSLVNPHNAASTVLIEIMAAFDSANPIRGTTIRPMMNIGVQRSALR